MKKLTLIITAVAILSSCSNNSINGFFYNPDGLVKKLEFKNGYCSFVWIIMPVTGQYEIKNDYIYVNTATEMGTLSFKIIDNNTLEGEGWLKGTYKKQ